MSDKILIIKTDKCCFVSDCEEVKGYHYDYHKTKIDKYLFNGAKAEKTYVKNWFIIKEYPNKIEVRDKDKRRNERYELIDKEMESKKMPLVIKKEDFKHGYDDPVYSLYEFKYETEKGKIIDADVELEVIMEVEEFSLPPAFEYNAITKKSWNKNPTYTITNENIKHQWLDKMIIPEVLLHEYPCEIGSSELYDLVRAHIKNNIDSSVAKITSDYDFCFTVKKLIPLISPKKFAYTNPFASTKKERQKVRHGVEKYKESIIFEMTSKAEGYRGYTPIEPITAKSEHELKIKVDEFLDDLMYHINKPLVSCPHCEGRGFIEEVEKFKINER